MSKLIISDYSIRQDSEGRFCLNDLHKAAGDENKYKPANWLRNQQVIDLIGLLNSEQSTTENRVIFIKQGVGTFVIKELIYAYAMWINAAFHVKVIRAYDSFVTNQTFDFLKPITEPLAINDFEWRLQAVNQALNNLKNAEVIIKLSGAELMAGGLLEK